MSAVYDTTGVIAPARWAAADVAGAVLLDVTACDEVRTDRSELETVSVR